MFKVLLGELELDSGNVVRPTAERGIRVGHYAQDLVPATGGSILEEALSAFGEVQSLQHEMRDLELSDAKKLPAGRLVKVSSVKIPRIIGKKNSMIDMVQSSTGCQISAGRNGYVWIAGAGNATLAEEAIRMIESQAHTHGLTDRVSVFLKGKAKQ